LLATPNLYFFGLGPFLKGLKALSVIFNFMKMTFLKAVVKCIIDLPIFPSFLNKSDQIGITCRLIRIFNFTD